MSEKSRNRGKRQRLQGSQSNHIDKSIKTSHSQAKPQDRSSWASTTSMQPQGASYTFDAKSELPFPALTQARETSEALVVELMKLATAQPKMQSKATPTSRRFSSQQPDTGLRPSQAWFPLMSPEELEPVTIPVTAAAAEMKEVYERHGLCLVTGVLSQEECNVMEKLWAEDLLQLIDADSTEEELLKKATQRLKEQGPRSWSANWNSSMGSKGMSSRHGLPHGAFAWSARLHPKVREIFAILMEIPAEELAVGLDNVFWASADEGCQTSNQQWLHCDQNYCTGITWPCAQGVLYVWSSESERASTTVVWPGSHREVYDQMMNDPYTQEYGKDKNHQLVQINHLSEESTRQPILQAALKGARRVPCPPGSLLLWDSRLIHQGWSGGPRLAQPVSWEPKERRPFDAWRRKLYMSVAGVSSSNSSSEGRVHGMATRTRPVAIPGQEGVPDIRPSLVPFGIAPGMEAQWFAMQDKIWAHKGNPHVNANRANVDEIKAILRKDVVDAL